MERRGSFFFLLIVFQLAINVQAGTLLSDSIRKLTAASAASSAASSAVSAAASSNTPVAIINPSLTSPLSTAYKLLLTSSRPLGSLLGSASTASAATQAGGSASSAASAGSLLSKAALKLPLLPLIPRGLRLATRPFSSVVSSGFRFPAGSVPVPAEPARSPQLLAGHPVIRRPYNTISYGGVPVVSNWPSSAGMVGFPATAAGTTSFSGPEEGDDDLMTPSGDDSSFSPSSSSSSFPPSDEEGRKSFDPLLQVQSSQQPSHPLSSPSFSLPLSPHYFKLEDKKKLFPAYHLHPHSLMRGKKPIQFHSSGFIHPSIPSLDPKNGKNPHLFFPSSISYEPIKMVKNNDPKLINPTKLSNSKLINPTKLISTNSKPSEESKYTLLTSDGKRKIYVINRNKNKNQGLKEEEERRLINLAQTSIWIGMNSNQSQPGKDSDDGRNQESRNGQPMELNGGQSNENEGQESRNGQTNGHEDEEMMKPQSSNVPRIVLPRIPGLNEEQTRQLILSNPNFLNPFLSNGRGKNQNVEPIMELDPNYDFSSLVGQSGSQSMSPPQSFGPSVHYNVHQPGQEPSGHDQGPAVGQDDHQPPSDPSASGQGNLGHGDPNSSVKYDDDGERVMYIYVDSETGKTIATKEAEASEHPSKSLPDGYNILPSPPSNPQIGTVESNPQIGTVESNPQIGTVESNPQIGTVDGSVVGSPPSSVGTIGPKYQIEGGGEEGMNGEEAGSQSEREKEEGIVFAADQEEGMNHDPKNGHLVHGVNGQQTGQSHHFPGHSSPDHNGGQSVNTDGRMNQQTFLIKLKRKHFPNHLNSDKFHSNHHSNHPLLNENVHQQPFSPPPPPPPPPPSNPIQMNHQNQQQTVAVPSTSSSSSSPDSQFGSTFSSPFSPSSFSPPSFSSSSSHANTHPAGEEALSSPSPSSHSHHATGFNPNLNVANPSSFSSPSSILNQEGREEEKEIRSSILANNQKLLALNQFLLQHLNNHQQFSPSGSNTSPKTSFSPSSQPEESHSSNQGMDQGMEVMTMVPKPVKKDTVFMLTDYTSYQRGPKMNPSQNSQNAPTMFPQLHPNLPTIFPAPSQNSRGPGVSPALHYDPMNPSVQIVNRFHPGMDPNFVLIHHSGPASTLPEGAVPVLFGPPINGAVAPINHEPRPPTTSQPLIGSTPIKLVPKKPLSILDFSTVKDITTHGGWIPINTTNNQVVNGNSTTSSSVNRQVAPLVKDEVRKEEVRKEEESVKSTTEGNEKEESLSSEFSENDAPIKVEVEDEDQMHSVSESSSNESNQEKSEGIFSPETHYYDSEEVKDEEKKDEKKKDGDEKRMEERKKDDSLKAAFKLAAIFDHDFKPIIKVDPHQAQSKSQRREREQEEEGEEGKRREELKEKESIKNERRKGRTDSGFGQRISTSTSTSYSMKVSVSDPTPSSSSSSSLAPRNNDPIHSSSSSVKMSENSGFVEEEGEDRETSGSESSEERRTFDQEGSDQEPRYGSRKVDKQYLVPIPGKDGKAKAYVILVNKHPSSPSEDAQEEQKK